MNDNVIYFYLVDTYNRCYLNYSIQIFDDDNNLVFQGNSIYGKIDFNYELYKLYKLVIKCNCGVFIKNVFFNKKYKNLFIYINNNYMINIFLTDKYYSNLPIIKGVIYFG